MKNLLIITSIILVTSSCLLTGNILSTQRINLQKKSSSIELNITTNVEKYSKSNGWFYGTIEIENVSNKSILFNFNQNLKVGDTILKADYNYLPISYAFEAFKIELKSSSKWTVVWKMEDYTSDMKVRIINDLTVKEFSFQ